MLSTDPGSQGRSKSDYKSQQQLEFGVQVHDQEFGAERSADTLTYISPLQDPVTPILHALEETRQHATPLLTQGSPELGIQAAEQKVREGGR